MVVNDVQNDRKAVEMAKIDERLELIHFTMQVLRRVSPLPFRIEQRVKGIEVRANGEIRDREIHFRREVVRAVVPKAELRLKLLDGQELKRGYAECREVRDF